MSSIFCVEDGDGRGESREVDENATTMAARPDLRQESM